MFDNQKCFDDTYHVSEKIVTRGVCCGALHLLLLDELGCALGRCTAISLVLARGGKLRCLTLVVLWVHLARLRTSVAIVINHDLIVLLRGSSHLLLTLNVMRLLAWRGAVCSKLHPWLLLLLWQGACLPLYFLRLRFHTRRCI